MVSTHQRRQQLLADTRQSAAAFIEDIDHIRGLVNAKGHEPREIRQLSNVLRRLLVNKELQELASPRVGKIHIMSPNNQRFIVRTSEQVLFYQCGSPLSSPLLQNFRMGFSPTHALSGQLDVFVPWMNSVVATVDTNSVPVRLDGFLSQRVICFRDKWATRKDVIKFAAICASGVHSKTPEAEVDKMLARVRFAVYLTQQDGEPAVQIDFDTIGNTHHTPPEMRDFIYDPQRIDLVMIELLAAAYYICESQDIAELTTTIRRELGIS